MLVVSWMLSCLLESKSTRFADDLVFLYVQRHSSSSSDVLMNGDEGEEEKERNGQARL